MTKTTAAAEDAFMKSVASIDDLMARLQVLRDNHFNADPECVRWGDVASVNLVAGRLREALAHYNL